jgi:RNA polymerase sigma-70 factor (ECF subfamily)
MLQACQRTGHEFIYRFCDGFQSLFASNFPVRKRGFVREAITPMKTADAENTELLSRIAQGDETAFARFYDQFAHGLYSLVYKILNDEKETEDVLQEGFTQIWKKAGTYDGNRSSAFTWAVMIMRNKAIDHIRSRQRQSRVVEEAALEFAHDTDAQEDEAVFQNEKRKIVRSALDKIPQDQRQAIDLAFFSGLTQMQIAAKLGEPLGTVKARIRRGLLKLRESLNGSSI